MTAPPRNARERLAWLRLSRSENVGPATFFALLARFGDAHGALDALPHLARRGGANTPLRIMSASEASREIEGLAALGAQLIAQGEPLYPARLAASEGAPPLIAVRGLAALLARDSLAIVGGRNASAAGVRMARDVAHTLGQAGLAVVSGLARGIDTAAHRGALETGTIGVLAGGVDNVYPPENQALYDAMCERGALVSEMPLGTQPQARHFPRRNRIISALGLAVLVVEAAERSGSLITANYAAEQGREVMAVPGSPLDPRARGANKLIRDGATLVQSAEEVLEALAPLRASHLREPPARAVPAPAPAAMDECAVDRLRMALLALLGPVPVEIDELIRQTGAPPALLQAALVELELAGRAARRAGQRVSLSLSPP